MADQEKIERMAVAILRIMQEREDCLPHDLVGNGFTIDEINTYWATAKAIAVLKAGLAKR